MSDYFGVIYKITNILNGKIYIGQTTKSIEKRFGQHKCATGNRNSSISSSIRKYGEENFSIEIIDSRKFGQSFE